MSFLACSSGVQHDFDDLPPSAVEESPGTPARFRSLRPVITSTGLVRYAALVEDPSLLLHNVAVVQDYSELDWGSKEDSLRNIAFYCNAYNIWAMYLVFKKMRKHGLAWHGEFSEFLDEQHLPYALLQPSMLSQVQPQSKQELTSFTSPTSLSLDRKRLCSRSARTRCLLRQLARALTTPPCFAALQCAATLLVWPHVA